MPVHASQLYARNVVQPAAPDDRTTGEVVPDFDDEIVAGVPAVDGTAGDRMERQ